MSPEAHVFKGLNPGCGAGWRGDSALLEEEVHHWSGFWLLPVHSLCLPLGLEMWSLSSLHQPPAARPPQQISLQNQKSKKKIPSSFYKLLWPWCVGTATGKQERQGVEQSGGCARARPSRQGVEQSGSCARARPSQPFDADSGYVVWGVVSGIRRLIHSCWKSHIQIIESGKRRVWSLHPSKTCMHLTLRLPAVSLYLNILEFNFLLVSAPTEAFLRVFSWWRSLRFHAFSRVLHLCWPQPRNWVGQLFPHPCHHHIFPSSVNSTLI